MSLLKVFAECGWHGGGEAEGDWILFTIYYILYTIYYILYKQQQKISESFPGKYFSPFLGPSNENAENLLPEITFDPFRG